MSNNSCKTLFELLHEPQLLQILTHLDFLICLCGCSVWKWLRWQHSYPGAIIGLQLVCRCPEILCSQRTHKQCRCGEVFSVFPMRRGGEIKYLQKRHVRSEISRKYAKQGTKNPKAPQNIRFQNISLLEVALLVSKQVLPFICSDFSPFSMLFWNSVKCTYLDCQFPKEQLKCSEYN